MYLYICVYKIPLPVHKIGLLDQITRTILSYLHHIVVYVMNIQITSVEEYVNKNRNFGLDNVICKAYIELMSFGAEVFWVTCLQCRSDVMRLLI